MRGTPSSVQVPAAPRAATTPHAGQAWTQRHRDWLGQLRFSDRGLGADVPGRARRRTTCCSAAAIGWRARCSSSRRRRRGRAAIARLRCLRGIDVLSAVGLQAEICDWQRFSHPKQLSAYLGLVPCEDSSGERRRQGSITKAGSQARPPPARRGGLALPLPATRLRRARAPPTRSRPARGRDRLALPAPPARPLAASRRRAGKAAHDHRRCRRPRARDLLLGARPTRVAPASTAALPWGRPGGALRALDGSRAAYGQPPPSGRCPMLESEPATKRSS